MDLHFLFLTESSVLLQHEFQYLTFLHWKQQKLPLFQSSSLLPVTFQVLIKVHKRLVCCICSLTEDVLSDDLLLLTLLSEIPITLLLINLI